MNLFVFPISIEFMTLLFAYHKLICMVNFHLVAPVWSQDVTYYKNIILFHVKNKTKVTWFMDDP